MSKKVPKVTKAGLVDLVYQETHFEKKVIQSVFESVLDELKHSLEGGNTIELRGFGTFEPRLRKGRVKARNPKTGEHLSVEPHFVAAFRAGRELKSSMWKLPVPKKSGK
jgi:integration host factor subunit beta